MSDIEVFADVGCPFTHIGLRRFVARRAELGRDDVRLIVRSWPLEIVNGTPMQAAFIAEEVDEITGQLGKDFFVGFREAAFPSTSMPAMALAAAAYDVGAEVGEHVSLELRYLLFEQGVDIADRATLRDVGERHGVVADLDDETRVRAEHAAGVERGVIGSPHFFTPAGGFFCPALDVSRDDAGHLRVTADPEEFDRFVASCLS